MTIFACTQHGVSMFSQEQWDRHTERFHTDLGDLVGPGDFVQYTMVTDTVILEVLAVTPTTIKTRTTRTGDIVKSEDDGSGWPRVWRAALPDTDGGTRTFRRRKDGSYRAGDTWGRLFVATEIDGTPVDYTDYRM